MSFKGNVEARLSAYVNNFLFVNINFLIIFGYVYLYQIFIYLIFFKVIFIICIMLLGTKKVFFFNFNLSISVIAINIFFNY